MFEIERFVDGSRAVDLGDVDWEKAASVGLTDDEARCLRYMSAVESHAVLYLPDLLAGHAARDHDLVPFLSCWAYEETQHGRAIDRFLAAAGRPAAPSSRESVARGARWQEAFEALASRSLAHLTPHFIAVHMAWGALNEMTAALAYTELARRTRSPELAKLLTRLAKDERRHQAFYYQQAQRRLLASGLARALTRFALERTWSPVGEGVAETESFGFIGAMLFDDARGAEQLRSIDRTMSRLPGLEGFERVARRVMESVAAFKRRERQP